jgi:hypothetical protein
VSSIRPTRRLNPNYRTRWLAAGPSESGQRTNPLTRERAAREGGACGGEGVTK